jgi:GT2 family glycosyltransferase
MLRVGKLDERFKLGGYEDLDYSLRLRAAGYDLLLARKIFVHHYSHRTFTANAVPPETVRKNLRLLLEKWTVRGLDRLGYKARR